MNIFSRAYVIVSTKENWEMTEGEALLVAKAVGFVSNTLPKIYPRIDQMPISQALLIASEGILWEGGKDEQPTD